MRSSATIATRVRRIGCHRAPASSSGPGRSSFSGSPSTRPGRVLDVGGGAGEYASWLLARGYDVTLVDPVEKHVEQAATRFAAGSAGTGNAEVGDARSLRFADDTYDAVLLLGPLYHLTERADRLKALRESARVLRPGGVVVAAAISRYASLLDGFSRQLVRDPAFVRILERDLRDGQHRNPTDEPAYFTTAYFHRPDELRRELDEAGLAVERLIAVEGPFWCLPDELWHDRETRDLMVRMAGMLQSDPVMLGVSAHILAVGRKPHAATRNRSAEP